MRALLITAALAFYGSVAVAQDLETCGVQRPWETPQTPRDTAVQSLVACTQETVDNVWSVFHMADGGWDRYGFNFDPCTNMNTPLARTMNGALLMRFAAPSPTCDATDKPLDWAYCFATELIVKLVAKCDGGYAAALTYTWGLDQWNERTELYKGFYYDFGPPMRAASFFHEARHVDDDCNHTVKCPAGVDKDGNQTVPGCDPQFEAGCVNGKGKGSYAWTAIWLHRYAIESGAINADLRAYAVSNANFILGRNFEVTPCFTYIPGDGHVNDTGCPK